MKGLLPIAITLTLTGSAQAFDVFSHMVVCRRNMGCMREQVKARELWHNGRWDNDLRRVCKKHVTSFP